MDRLDGSHSWFGAPQPTESAEESGEFVRLWNGFMTARLTLGVVLVLLQTTLYAINPAPHGQILIAISTAYFFSALAARVRARPRPLGKVFNTNWLTLVGLDVLVFLSLQALQGHSINYTPLCALPILLTSVLGTMRLALGTAAGVTMLLLGGTVWAYLESPGDTAPYLAQSALSGVGYFVIAVLSNQLSTRLAKEGRRARSNQLAARIQQQVNELVIESLPDGVLIVDGNACVRAANPAARSLLGSARAQTATVFFLHEEAGWSALLTLALGSLETGQLAEQEVTIHHAGQGPRRMRARTRLATTQSDDGDSLCVLFLQDLRELEARMRTEKLASMGRLSAAVAHEIRNPLAAISQANALLDEDISDPRLKKLTSMVSQNAKRLDRIVEDILKVSRIQPDAALLPPVYMNPYDWARRICNEWSVQNGHSQALQADLPSDDISVRFDPEHLRRVLVNLLDNAGRYATKAPDSIRVSGKILGPSHAMLCVWSDGAAMDQSVERHLFEPFFSSESRSTGLGLYICRELCERHGASVVYQRGARGTAAQSSAGNAFVITLLRPPTGSHATAGALATAP